LAVEVIREAMSLWFLVVGISHQQSLPGTSRGHAGGDPIGTAERVRAEARRIGPLARLGRSANPFNRIAPLPGTQTVRLPARPAWLGVSLGVFWNTIVLYRTFI